MTALERTGSGFFRIEDAVDLKELVEMTDDEIASLIIPMDETLVNLGCIELDSRRTKAFRNGNSSDAWSWKVTDQTEFDGLYRVYERGTGLFLGIGKTDDKSLVPQKVII